MPLSQTKNPNTKCFWTNLLYTDQPVITTEAEWEKVARDKEEQIR